MKKIVAFNSIALNICKDALNGKTGTIFIYGKDGSDKSGVMFGTDGVIPKSIEYILNKINNDASKKLVLSMRGVNDDILFDLFNQNLINKRKEGKLVVHNVNRKKRNKIKFVLPKEDYRNQTHEFKNREIKQLRNLVDCLTAEIAELKNIQCCKCAKKINIKHNKNKLSIMSDDDLFEPEMKNELDQPSSNNVIVPNNIKNKNEIKDESKNDIINSYEKKESQNSPDTSSFTSTSYESIFPASSYFDGFEERMKKLDTDLDIDDGDISDTSISSTDIEEKQASNAKWHEEFRLKLLELENEMAGTGK